MDLDKITVRLRPRSPYEAADLGFVLVRRFGHRLLGGWVLGALPFVLAALLVLAFTGMVWRPILALWWLKPLFGRTALFVLSRSFFGEVPPPAQTRNYALRAGFSLSVLWDLSWRRFSPFRSVTMPVRELERLRGSAARQRVNVLLRREVRAPALLLIVVGFAVEWTLFTAALLLLFMVMPSAGESGFWNNVDLIFGDYASFWVRFYMILAYFVCMSLVEVAYVAAGFGIYVNRRVVLEGWDIELVFKRMAQRLRRRAATGASAVAALLVTMSVVVGLGPGGLSAAWAESGLEAHALAEGDDAPAPADAMEAQDDPQEDGVQEDGEQADDNQEWTPEQVRVLSRKAYQRVSAAQFSPADEIEQILQAPEFGKETVQRSWRLREELFRIDQDTSKLGRWAQLLRDLVLGMEVILWGLVILAVFVSGYFIWRRLRIPRRAAPSEPVARAQVSLQAEEEPAAIVLPDDIVEAAMRAWQQGDAVQSLSLLYRGTIRALAKTWRIEISPAMTTRQAIEMVRQQGGPIDYVSDLSNAWTHVVYAGRHISDADAHALFAAWKMHFSAAAPQSSAERAHPRGRA